ncbi:response regulator transcription factor [Aquimarina algiphila]|uniref:response regulator transcription factor n=1 Tax=Aquimarina algiphila TaxID=2047982 RepID=UPI0024926ADA|nr:response regulator transcription factor [Aquimarina algiphila]
MSKPISLAIVDDDSLLVSLLTSFFESHNMLVSICAKNGIEFFNELKNIESVPDIVVLDLRMKKMNGMEILELLKNDFPEVKVAVISSYYSNSSIGFMLKAGVNAFLPKGILPEQLLEAIHEIDQKDFYFTSEQIEVLRDQLPENPSAKPQIVKHDQISKREFEVLDLICMQYTAKEIGEKLFITQRTVEGHRTNLLLKTGVKNTAGLVIYAVRENLFDPSKLVLY